MWNPATFFDKDIYHIFSLKTIRKGTNPLREEHAKMRQLEDTGKEIFF